MFNYAITKKICSRFNEGITTAELGKPDLQLALQQHSEYSSALKACGLEVIELKADEEFPDSCFVEDVAVIADEVAVITNPGATSRNGEIKAIIPVLERFRALAFIEPPGTLEGGDVMQVEKHFFVGLTHRTNEHGAKQLKAILTHYGYSISVVPVTTVLHLKTAVNYIGSNRLLASNEFTSHPLFSQFQIIPVGNEELYAANCLLINEKILMPRGFERLKSRLLKLNCDIIEVSTSEFEKMDGGLSCLSLRFS